MKVVFIIVLIVVVFAFLHHVFPLIQVIGDSMYPTYLDGEIIVGTKLYRKSKLKKGDVVLYQSPTDDKTVIKRIDQIEKRGRVLYFYCLGDNPPHSYDSRNYGFVSSKNFVCKVINQRRNINDVCNQKRRNS